MNEVEARRAAARMRWEEEDLKAEKKVLKQLGLSDKADSLEAGSH